MRGRHTMLHYLELPGWVPDYVLAQLINDFSGEAKTQLQRMIRTCNNATPTRLHKRSISQESASAVSTTSEGSHQVPYNPDTTGLESA
jgi:hypothetical protein